MGAKDPGPDALRTAARELCACLGAAGREWIRYRRSLMATHQRIVLAAQLRYIDYKEERRVLRRPAIRHLALTPGR
jgi:hypothetical protein